MAEVEWLVKRERGARQIVLRAEQADIQAFCEDEMRANPADGDVIVYQRYASCTLAALAPVDWTMGTPPPVP